MEGTEMIQVELWNVACAGHGIRSVANSWNVDSRFGASE
jgi:hypothetical protein